MMGWNALRAIWYARTVTFISYLLSLENHHASITTSTLTLITPLVIECLVNEACLGLSDKLPVMALEKRAHWSNPSFPLRGRGCLFMFVFGSGIENNVS